MKGMGGKSDHGIQRVNGWARRHGADIAATVAMAGSTQPQGPELASRERGGVATFGEPQDPERIAAGSADDG